VQKLSKIIEMNKFKIIPYDRKVLEKFRKEKANILKIIRNCEVHHIGSTAVAGLGGKGIVDIMVGIKDWEEVEEIIKKLKRLGFLHIHPKENGRIFLSKNSTLSQNNIHLHITKIGNKTYKELLFFRDYLRGNKKEADRYFKLKLKWLKESGGNGDNYKKLKEKYIKKILERNKEVEN